MKKLHSLTLACISFISITSSSTILAGNRPGALTITPVVGYEFFADKRHIKDTVLGAGMLGFNFTGNWGIEGYYGIFNTKFKHSVHDNRQINGTLFAINAVYHFMPGCLFEPYVLAGPGITSMNPSRTSDPHNEGNINGALGLQFFIHKSVAFRVEARDVYTIVGGKNDVVLNGGLSVLFDLCCV